MPIVDQSDEMVPLFSLHPEFGLFFIGAFRMQGVKEPVTRP